MKTLEGRALAGAAGWVSVESLGVLFFLPRERRFFFVAAPPSIVLAGLNSKFVTVQKAHTSCWRVALTFRLKTQRAAPCATSVESL